MGAATTAAPYGFWATNPTKKLAHWVYLLGQPLSRNRVFQNFSGEPPPPPPLTKLKMKRVVENRNWELYGKQRISRPWHNSCSHLNFCQFDCNLYLYISICYVWNLFIHYICHTVSVCTYRVSVYMPIFVMYCWRRVCGHTREECWFCQLQFSSFYLPLPLNFYLKDVTLNHSSNFCLLDEERVQPLFFNKDINSSDEY